jgi:cyclic pyranopterin phosphate synthase
MALIDAYGRKITYLRLSVTDRCNLRCLYCMPARGIAKLEHRDILRYEELLFLAETAVGMGIEKIRVTGGEPLVRRGIIGFLRDLSAIPGLRQLVLTTNGVLLQEMAADLKTAGVARLNISLDSLRPDTFARITQCGDLGRVLEGIRIAENLGFPVKLNMVVMRGINDGEIVDFARLTLTRPFSVRFIEYMPTLRDEGWESRVLPGDEILARIGREHTLLPLPREDDLSGPSRNYRINGAAGTIGIITPVSRHFCRECNRIRVTSTGRVRTCLFDAGEHDLRPLLQEGNRAALEEALRVIVSTKPEKHPRFSGDDTGNAFDMSKVGG